MIEMDERYVHIYNVLLSENVDDREIIIYI